MVALALEPVNENHRWVLPFPLWARTYPGLPLRSSLLAPYWYPRCKKSGTWPRALHPAACAPTLIGEVRAEGHGEKPDYLDGIMRLSATKAVTPVVKIYT